MVDEGFIVHGDNEMGWVLHSNRTLCEHCAHGLELKHITEDLRGR